MAATPQPARLGDRELLNAPTWSGRTTWIAFGGYHHRRHRPDIVATSPQGGKVATEVELQQQALPRLRGILSMYLNWRTDRRVGGVMYVCGDQDGADAVEHRGETFTVLRRGRAIAPVRDTRLGELRDFLVANPPDPDWEQDLRMLRRFVGPAQIEDAQGDGSWISPVACAGSRGRRWDARRTGSSERGRPRAAV